MKFTTVVVAGILAFASQTFASPTEVIGAPGVVLIDTPPTAEPGTSPFPSSLMFDTTAPSSFVSAVSSYISSESVAVTSLLSSLLSPTPAPSSPVTTATSPSTTVPTATTTATSTLSSTSTGAADRGQSLVSMSIVASVILGTVVASL